MTETLLFRTDYSNTNNQTNLHGRNKCYFSLIKDNLYKPNRPAIGYYKFDNTIFDNALANGEDAQHAAFDQSLPCMLR